nr:hypothetical protein [Nocardioides alcanivorans]
MSDNATVLHVGGASPYDVFIGRDLADRLPGILGDSVKRVALLYAEPLNEIAQAVFDVLLQDYDVLALALPEGEQAKSSSVVHECWEALGEAGFTRSDAVVTFGGGATTDVGGFVAASWLRGSVWCTCPARCWRWSTRRWAARRASTPAPARTSWAPSTSPPECSATWRCSTRSRPRRSRPGWARS